MLSGLQLGKMEENSGKLRLVGYMCCHAMPQLEQLYSRIEKDKLYNLLQQALDDQMKCL